MKNYKKKYQIKNQLLTIFLTSILFVFSFFLVVNIYSMNKINGQTINADEYNNVIKNISTNEEITLKKLTILETNNLNNIREDITLENSNNDLIVTMAQTKAIHPHNGGFIADNNIGIGVDINTMKNNPQNRLYIRGGNAIFNDTTDHKVGIQVYKPQEKLHVVGNIKIENGQLCIGSKCINSFNNTTTTKPNIEIKTGDIRTQYQDNEVSIQPVNCSNGYTLINCIINYNESFFNAILNGELSFREDTTSTSCSYKYKCKSSNNCSFNTTFTAICAKIQ